MWCQSGTIFHGTSRTPSCDIGVSNILGKAAEAYGVILDGTTALICFDFDPKKKTSSAFPVVSVATANVFLAFFFVWLSSKVI